MTDVLTTDLEVAVLEDDGTRVAHFGVPQDEARAAVSGEAVFDLRHLGVITVDGEDAVDFLQGQLANDVSEVTDTRAQTSAWCSPKGRVLARLLVFRHRRRFGLELPRSILDRTLQRMRMFVLRARVTMEDAGESLAIMGVVGDAAAAPVAKAVGELPAEPDAVRATEDLTVIRLLGSRPRYQVVGAPDAVGALWNACRAGARPAGADAWDLLDIEAGVANIGPDTSDAFVPQMINLDRIGGVSFTKGCYVGQEIVARTQHLGRIKRRMYRARREADPALAPGDILEGAGSFAQTRAHVVDARPAADGGLEVLAVMPIEDADAAGTALPLRDGTRLVFLPLPYTLEV